MSHKFADVAALEELRESGDYLKIADLLGGGWQTAPEFEEDTVRLRLLAAEIAGRTGQLDEMEAALARTWTQSTEYRSDWQPALS